MGYIIFAIGTFLLSLLLKVVFDEGWMFYFIFYISIIYPAIIMLFDNYASKLFGKKYSSLPGYFYAPLFLVINYASLLVFANIFINILADVYHSSNFLFIPSTILLIIILKKRLNLIRSLTVDKDFDTIDNK